MADRTVALLLVDVLEAFFTPGRPAYYPDSVKVLGPLRELLAKARQHDRMVVHAVERHRPGLVDFEHHKLPVHCEIGDDQSPYVEGFEPIERTGAVFDDSLRKLRTVSDDSLRKLRTVSDDSLRKLREVEIPKRRYSAFYATDLDLLLREQGVRTLVVGGVKTNVCVRATVQDAFAAGYEILLAKEATNSNRPHLAEASLEDIDRYFGSVVSVEEALERL